MGTALLEGKFAVITGAASKRGLGLATARLFAQHGASVAILDLDEAAAQAAAAELGQRHVGMACNVTDQDSVKAAFDALIAQWDRIDVLVNNAGIIRRDDAAEFSEADWDAVIDVNLKALFFTCQAFAREALPRGMGKIVNIASLLSFQGGIRVPSYTASKHGVAGLTKLMANEWAAKGLNVNAIAPGYIETNNTAALRADPERSKAILDRIPAGRWGRPEDIAQTAVFLAAPASDYINGAILNVDGGWLAR